MSNDFNKQYRMLKRSDFDFVKDQSHFLHSRSILGFYRKVDSSNTKLGLSISKKYGNAVKRNKLKRIIRNYFRTSEFKHNHVFINLVPNMKFLNSIKKDYSLFEERVLIDLPNLFKSIK